MDPAEEFAEQIRALAARLENNKEHALTEEATKHSMVLPFLQVLGYDVFNPIEVISEYPADFHGLKKDARIDYVLAINKEPKILIEVKSANSLLPETSSQLLKYFHAMRIKFPVSVRFAILTNGIQYNFFSDIDQQNIMDAIPFSIININAHIRGSEIKQLMKFQKNNFNADEIYVTAIDLKYAGVLKRYFKNQFNEPEEEFIKFLIKEAMKPFKIMATKHSVKKFSQIVKNAYKQYISEIVADITIRASDEAKKIESDTIKEILPERAILRQLFWTKLLMYAKTKTDLHSKVSPGRDCWCGMGAGTSGLGYNYVIFQHQARIELYIDKGEHAVNKEIFDRLLTAKEGIEKTFGGSLEWERKNEKRACRIKKDLNLGGYRDDEQNWPKVHGAMVDAMVRLHKAISPHLQYLMK
jgi:predicted type IV restriction endonuclease